MTAAATRARSRKEYVPVGDIRTPIRPAAVADALERAAAAVVDTEKERFLMPQAWESLRRSFHTLPEADRRIALLRLIIEEGARVAHDRGASFSNT